MKVLDSFDEIKAKYYDIKDYVRLDMDFEDGKYLYLFSLKFISFTIKRY